MTTDTPTLQTLVEVLKEVRARILMILGGERDAMPPHVVKAFQDIAKDINQVLGREEV